MIKASHDASPAELATSARRRGQSVSGDWLLAHLPPHLREAQKLVMLDVGCWEGDLLAGIPERWIRRGIEPNSDAAKRARHRGLEVVEGFVEEADLGPAGYDLVTLIDVIEHLPDPLEVLSRLAEALRPGGYLVVLTGDAGSRGSRVWGSDWYYLHYPEHVSFFTEKSLLASLRAAGLVPISSPRLRHPMARVAGDLAAAAHHIFARRDVTGDVSLHPHVGANWLTLSRMLRGRDHLLALAAKP